MEELKVGLYGRTNLGNIIKFAYFCDENNERYTNKVILIDEVTKSPSPYYYFKEDERIVKESKNIIDLVEVGDLIHLIIPPDEYCNKPIETLWYLQDGMINNTKNSIELKELQLLGIITKQQLESIEYKIDN